VENVGFLCPNCKSAIEDSWISCPHCGLELKKDLQKSLELPIAINQAQVNSPPRRTPKFLDNLLWWHIPTLLLMTMLLIFSWVNVITGSTTALSLELSLRMEPGGYQTFTWVSIVVTFAAIIAMVMIMREVFAGKTNRILLLASGTIAVLILCFGVIWKWHSGTLGNKALEKIVAENGIFMHTSINGAGYTAIILSVVTFALFAYIAVDTRRKSMSFWRDSTICSDMTKTTTTAPEGTPALPAKPSINNPEMTKADSPEPSHKVCEQCGTKLDPGTHFCTGCGAKVEQ
jgi:hypothetical protein